MIIADFETWRQITGYDIQQLKRDTPSDLNNVDVYKYKVTIEKIEEPVENIIARLEERKSRHTNWHTKSRINQAIAELKKEALK